MKVPAQPEVNIGMVGHVDHGKTTLTYALTGEWADRHSEELKRGITIRLGYADAPIYLCPKCGKPHGYTNKAICPRCGTRTEFQRAVSFVDAPGHESLMATMLSGASLMDGALLLIAANEKCPQPQTKEHLMALEISGIKNIIVVQNKIDVVSPERAKESYKEIKEFLKGTVAENAPIIPISAHHEANIDILLAAIEKYIPTPERDPSKPPLMYIARSFDINKPGDSIEKIKGGVIGGSLMQGVLRVGDEIEILPGLGSKEHPEKYKEPIRTKVTSIVSGGKEYDEVHAGGLLGVGTTLDPAITKSDNLAGKIMGLPGTLPEVRNQFTMETHLLERVVGTEEEIEVQEIKTNEVLMLSIGTMITVGVVKSARKDEVEMYLKLPVCPIPDEKIAIGRRIGNKWRLIGYGVIKD